MLEIRLRDAEATLSKVIDNALKGEPSIITLHGRPAAVVLSFEEWDRLARMPSFGRLLAEAPLEPGDLAERNWGSLRDTHL